MFTGESVGQYMSPYMQNVVDVQKQQAQLDFDRSQAGRDAAAVQAGAFGGSRQAVGDYLAQEGLARQMGDIQATGQQQAFQQAATQFGADRAAQMDMESFALPNWLGYRQVAQVNLVVCKLVKLEKQLVSKQPVPQNKLVYSKP